MFNSAIIIAVEGAGRGAPNKNLRSLAFSRLFVPSPSVTPFDFTWVHFPLASPLRGRLFPSFQLPTPTMVLI